MLNCSLWQVMISEDSYFSNYLQSLLIEQKRRTQLFLQSLQPNMWVCVPYTHIDLGFLEMGREKRLDRKDRDAVLFCMAEKLVHSISPHNMSGWFMKCGKQSSLIESMHWYLSLSLSGSLYIRSSIFACSMSVAPFVSGRDIIFPTGLFLPPLFHPTYPRYIRDSEHIISKLKLLLLFIVPLWLLIAMLSCVHTIGFNISVLLTHLKQN